MRSCSGNPRGPKKACATEPVRKNSMRPSVSWASSLLKICWNEVVNMIVYDCIWIYLIIFDITFELHLTCVAMHAVLMFLNLASWHHDQSSGCLNKHRHPPKSSGLWVQPLQVQIWILGGILHSNTNITQPIGPIGPWFIIRISSRLKPQSVLLELPRKHSLRRAAQITKASGSWSYSCFSKGGQLWVQHSDFSLNPPKAPPGIWTLVPQVIVYGGMAIWSWVSWSSIRGCHYKSLIYKQFLRIGNHL